MKGQMMIKYVICKRHRRLHYGHVETYNTYQRIDGGVQVITDICKWKGATFLDRERAEEEIRELRCDGKDAYSQMVMVIS